MKAKLSYIFCVRHDGLTRRVSVNARPLNTPYTWWDVLKLCSTLENNILMLPLHVLNKSMENTIYYPLKNTVFGSMLFGIHYTCKQSQVQKMAARKEQISKSLHSVPFVPLRIV